MLGKIVTAVCVAASLAALGARGTATASADTLEPGDVVRDNGVAAAVPPPLEMVSVEGVLPSGAVETLTIETTASGDVRLYDLGSESGSVIAGGGGGSHIAACQDDEFTLARLGNGQHYKWYDTLNWRWNGTNPSNLDPTRTLQSLREGGTNIVSLHDDCGLNLTLGGASIQYLGTGVQSVDINTNDSCQADHDRASFVGFGTLTRYIGYACTWAQTAYSPASAYESDIRLDTGTRWANEVRNCTYGYIVEAVMTHERGHSFGLGHVNEDDHGNLTMSTAIAAPCDNRESTLGRGDVLGLRALYPPQ